MANDQPPRKPRPPLASTTSTTSPSSRASTEADSISTNGKRTPHNPKTPDAKHFHRVLKRPSAARAATDPKTTETRYKRVWKACERCRMKKTKCDGENPCKRCKDDGVMCTAGTRKKTEYKQVPNGYVELLENQSYQMQRTILKLYTMVREKQEWTSEEPSFNKEGQPVIHDIARALGVGGHSDMEEDIPENGEQSHALAEKLAAREAATKRQGMKRESIDDTPYMVRQHSNRHSEADSDTSFSTEDRPSTLPSSTQPMRLAPKTLAPLQIDQMQYLPGDMTSASQFDEFYDPSYLTSPMYSDGFPSESQDEDMMWMDNRISNGISASQPPLPSMAISPLSTAQAMPLAQRLDAMSSMGRINAFEASTVAGTRGAVPRRGMCSQEYIYDIGAPQHLGQGMGGIAGTGTIRPGMLEKAAPLSYEAMNGVNGMSVTNSVGAPDGPFSFKNFHTPQ